MQSLIALDMIGCAELLLAAAGLASVHVCTVFWWPVANKWCHTTLVASKLGSAAEKSQSFRVVIVSNVLWSANYGRLDTLGMLDRLRACCHIAYSSCSVLIERILAVNVYPIGTCKLSVYRGRLCDVDCCTCALDIQCCG